MRSHLSSVTTYYHVDVEWCTVVDTTVSCYSCDSCSKSFCRHSIWATHKRTQACRCMASWLCWHVFWSSNSRRHHTVINMWCWLTLNSQSKSYYPLTVDSMNFKNYNVLKRNLESVLISISFIWQTFWTEIWEDRFMLHNIYFYIYINSDVSVWASHVPVVCLHGRFTCLLYNRYQSMGSEPQTCIWAAVARHVRYLWLCILKKM